MQPETQKGVQSTAKRNADLKQIPTLGSDAPRHLSKAVTTCIPAWSQEGSVSPCRQPDLGALSSYTTQVQAATGRETKHPQSYSPFPSCGCHRSAPLIPYNPACKFALRKGRQVVTAHIAPTSPLQ